jgi:hypothetical protein
VTLASLGCSRFHRVPERISFHRSPQHILIPDGDGLNFRANFSSFSWSGKPLFSRRTTPDFIFLVQFPAFTFHFSSFFRLLPFYSNVMVLGFGKKKKPVPEPVVIRTSPSLPQLPQQRIPWPEDLVDLDAVYAEPLSSSPEQQGGSRPVKTSFQSVRGPIPFHKPFREGTTTVNGTLSPKSVAGLFGSGIPPPSSFPGTGARVRAGSNSNARTRRNKFAPTFNVMVSLRIVSHTRAFNYCSPFFKGGRA